MTQKSTAHPRHLQRAIGPFSLILAAVGGMIGSGWLFGPFLAAQSAGPAAILSWMIGGVLMMVIASTFAELAAKLPLAGGMARFLQLSHGTIVSFTMAWIGWLSAAAVAPIETMALMRYATNYLPGLMHQVHGVYVLTLLGAGVAAILMGVMCLLNAYGVKLLAKTNTTVVLLKLFVPVLTVVILLIHAYHPSNLTTIGFSPMGLKGILSALPAAGVIFSFIGYSPAIQLAGEAKNPRRAVPIAIIGGLSLCILLYVILQWVFICALPLHTFVKGWSQLSFSGDAGPFAGLMVMLGLLFFSKVLFIDATISPFGTALIYTASTARMAYAMGENGYMPRSLLQLNHHRVPGRLILLNYVIGLILFLPFPTWQSLIEFLVSALVFAYAVGPLALIVLRRQFPKTEQQTFQVPCPMIVCFLAFYICNLIIFWSGWVVVHKMLIAILLGYVALFVYRRFDSKVEPLALPWWRAWWIYAYLISIAVVSYVGTFGGRQLVPFGWDFLMVAIQSLVIFVAATHHGHDYLKKNDTRLHFHLKHV